MKIKPPYIPTVSFTFGIIKLKKDTKISLKRVKKRVIVIILQNA